MFRNVLPHKKWIISCAGLALILFIALSGMISTGWSSEKVKTQEKAQTLLVVRTTPGGADVRLNGKPVGSSDELLPVEPGKYKLVVDLSGHEPVEQEITIRNGRITRIVLTLEKKGSVSVEETVKRVKEVVRTVATCVEGEPRLKKALKSLKTLDDTIVVATLNDELTSETDTIRRAAIYILWQGDMEYRFKSIEPAVPRLIKLCDHKKEFTRGMAALALGANQVDKAYDRLVDMVKNDKSGYARRCAAIALGWLGNPKAIGVLRKALKDPDPLVQANARTGLKLLENKTASSEKNDGPKIVGTIPKIGATKVDPSINEIIVTFDQDMSPNFSWQCLGSIETEPTYWRDKRTCVKPVRLKPGRHYRIVANPTPTHGFTSTKGVLLKTTEIYFSTKGPVKKVQPPHPPQIVSTTPKTGAINVDPSITEITVTFDQDMSPDYSWTEGREYFPKRIEGKEPFWRDKRTCVLPVELEKGQFYLVGINSSDFRNFTNTAGVPADLSQIYFVTKGATPKVKARMNRPKLISISPENGATDVDPNLKEVRVTFNRKMGKGFSWIGGGPHFPKIPEGMKPRWSKDGKTCILPVQLKPDWKYNLGLNNRLFHGFTSDSGVFLEPVSYQFRTRAK